jgi:hypothetical protein
MSGGLRHAAFRGGRGLLHPCRVPTAGLQWRKKAKKKLVASLRPRNRVAVPHSARPPRLLFPRRREREARARPSTRSPPPRQGGASEPPRLDLRRDASPPRLPRGGARRSRPPAPHPRRPRRSLPRQIRPPVVASSLSSVARRAARGRGRRSRSTPPSPPLPPADGGGAHVADREPRAARAPHTYRGPPLSPSSRSREPTAGVAARGDATSCWNARAPLPCPFCRRHFLHMEMGELLETV